MRAIGPSSAQFVAAPLFAKTSCRDTSLAESRVRTSTITTIMNPTIRSSAHDLTHSPIPAIEISSLICSLEFGFTNPIVQLAQTSGGETATS
ncbi:hypothetical protein FS842_004353 [Serendipita sp. 407]|nr:hypothetical protein FS842_004353 [Serendipita sp. 407]